MERFFLQIVGILLEVAVSRINLDIIVNQFY